MRLKKGLDILYKYLLALIGTIGIMSIPLLTVFSDSRLMPVYLGAVIFCCIFVVVFSMKGKLPLFITTGIILLTTVVVIVERTKLLAGLRSLIQALNEEFLIKSKGSIELPNIGFTAVKGRQGFLSPLMALLVFITFIVAFLVCLNVMYIRSILVAVILELPFMALFITGLIIPHKVSFMLAVFFVFGVSALNKKEKMSVSGYISFAICIISVIIVNVFAGENTYSKPAIFDKAYEIANDTMEGKLGQDVVGNSGVSNGELGKFDRIEVTNEPLAQITTQNTGERQYFKIYVGAEYKYKDNYWDNENYKMQIDEGRILSTLHTVYLTRDRYASIIAPENPSKIEDIFQTYRYSINNSDGTESRHAYILKNKNYNAFEEAKRLASPGVLEYAGYEERVYKTYLGVPEELNDTLSNIIGERKLESASDILQYAEYIREFFVDNYQYSLAPGRTPKGRDFVQYFLETNKKGYCTYFATAATMMFRYVGVPARYCEGYSVSKEKIDNSWTGVNTVGTNQYDIYTFDVLDSEAHAWTEIYIDGYGWLTIDVTPGYTDYIQQTDTNNRNSGTQSGGNEERQTVTEASSEGVTSSQENDVSEADSITEDTQTPDSQTGITDNKDNSAQNSIRAGIGAIITILVIFIILSVIIIFAVRYRIHKRRLENSNIFELYEYIEKLLIILGYKRLNNMEYERYSRKLAATDRRLAEADITGCMDVILKMKFSNEKEVNPQDSKIVSDCARNIRKYVYEKQNTFGRFVLKYIKCL